MLLDDKPGAIESTHIIQAPDAEKVEMFPGFWRQTLVHNEKLMLCLFTWRAGANLPAHSHPHDQAGYVISGAVELTVGNETVVTRAGCSYIVHSWEVHSARALEDSLVIDAFSPARTEYVAR
ncbi:MAG TPA: cupin domain-containing protein [Vicinamibacterales bacterium]|nr:cupin domain-containing protein [Vicinamibacterales bacterium]